MFARRADGRHTVNRLREEMDKLFHDFMGDLAPAWSPGWFGTGAYPAVNLWEDDQNLFAEAELPGLSMDDVEVFVVGNELTIRGERKAPQVEEGVAYHRQERTGGRFNRVLPLPMQIDAEKVEATFRDGVLTIQMPKAEAAKPRKIRVQTGT
jgi:HSP20 family protein